jgi:hypothetical protein
MPDMGASLIEEDHVSDRPRGSGANTAREIEEQIETRVGHPTGDQGGSADESRMREERADEFLGVSPRSHQHARKGQAESPRELNPNQPEKKRAKDR